MTTAETSISIGLNDGPGHHQPRSQIAIILFAMLKDYEANGRSPFWLTPCLIQSGHIAMFCRAKV